MLFEHFGEYLACVGNLGAEQSCELRDHKRGANVEFHAVVEFVKHLLDW
jgi:hypothetical protein